jgi:hypothetical protein
MIIQLTLSLNLESKKLTPLLNIAPQKVTPENSLP